MKWFSLLGLLVVAASAACTSECSTCLTCVMANITNYTEGSGRCAGCDKCYEEEKGCALNTTTYNDTDAFGQYLKGAACEKFALDFYGPFSCKSEAIEEHVATCYNKPLMKQYDECVKADYESEVNDCVVAATTLQVTGCLDNFVEAAKNASVSTTLKKTYDDCQDTALVTQGES